MKRINLRRAMRKGSLQWRIIVCPKCGRTYIGHPATKVKCEDDHRPSPSAEGGKK